MELSRPETCQPDQTVATKSGALFPVVLRGLCFAATVGEHGEFYNVDLLQELIKYKGHQVAPAELEALLLTHPDILDAAVVGATDADGQEIPKAFVVRRSATALDENAVMAFVAAHVAPYIKVRAFSFIDVVPKCAAGKVLFKNLRGS